MTDTNGTTPASPRVFNVNGKEISFDKCSEATVLKAWFKGMAHVFGNEAASRVTAWKKSDEGKNADEAAIDAKLVAVQNDFYDRVVSGDWGNSVRASSGEAGLSKLETRIRTLAWDDISVELKAGGYKLPSGKKTVAIEGLGDMTRDQLIERRLFEPKKQYDQYKAKAASQIAAEEKQAARRVEKAKEAGVSF
jgi:hypothetical protein